MTVYQGARSIAVRPAPSPVSRSASFAMPRVTAVQPGLRRHPGSARVADRPTTEYPTGRRPVPDGAALLRQSVRPEDVDTADALRAYYETMPKFESAAEVMVYLQARGETLEQHEHLPVQDAWDNDNWVCEVPGCEWSGGASS